jgi:hypothetical protein
VCRLTQKIHQHHHHHDQLIGISCSEQKAEGWRFDEGFFHPSIII